jgi:hypothetical protein
MDPVADLQAMTLPLLDFLARNSGIITIVVVIVAAAWQPLLADNARRPRELYASLFGRGTSDGRGDEPAERPQDDTKIDWEDGERR